MYIKSKLVPYVPISKLVLSSSELPPQYTYLTPLPTLKDHVGSVSNRAPLIYVIVGRRQWGTALSDPFT